MSRDCGNVDEATMHQMDEQVDAKWLNRSVWISKTIDIYLHLSDAEGTPGLRPRMIRPTSGHPKILRNRTSASRTHQAFLDLQLLPKGPAIHLDHSDSRSTGFLAGNHAARAASLYEMRMITK